jgi:hypothetical protein
MELDNALTSTEVGGDIERDEIIKFFCDRLQSTPDSFRFKFDELLVRFKNKEFIVMYDILPQTVIRFFKSIKPEDLRSGFEQGLGKNYSGAYNKKRFLNKSFKNIEGLVIESNVKTINIPGEQNKKLYCKIECIGEEANAKTCICKFRAISFHPNDYDITSFKRYSDKAKYFNADTLERTKNNFMDYISSETAAILDKQIATIRATELVAANKPEPTGTTPVRKKQQVIRKIVKVSKPNP